MLRGSKPTSATLVKKGSEYYIHIQVKSEAPEQIQVDKVLGVDLGITDIAVTSEGQKFGGKTIKLIKNHYASMRAVLQQKAVKGTRSSRRRCRELQKRLSGKESTLPKANQPRNQQSHSDQSPGDPCKDCSGRSNRNQRRRQPESRKEPETKSQWLGFLSAQGVLDLQGSCVGVPLVLVDPAYTSQTCHICGEHGIRNGKELQVSFCGWSGDADFNGAKNIAFLGRYVVRPGGSEGLPSIKAVLSGLLKAPSL